MSYEYKEINRAIVQQNGVDNNINRANSLQELDEVYAKAEKLLEYEASKCRTHVNYLKAEAFDAILKSYDEALSEGHMADEVSNIINKYESGDHNV